jgi:hypothetical protein
MHSDVMAAASVCTCLHLEGKSWGDLWGTTHCWRHAPTQAISLVRGVDAQTMNRALAHVLMVAIVARGAHGAAAGLMRLFVFVYL